MTTSTYLTNLITQVGNLVNLAFPIVGGIAMLVFLWGIVTVIRHPEKTDGKNRIVMGVVALFVMVSIWGIVAILRVLLGLDVYEPPIPGIQTTSTMHQVCEYNAAIGGNICYYQQ